MEKGFQTISIMMCIIMIFVSIASLISPIIAAQDTTGPQITDLSTGNPVIGGEFTVVVQADDPSGIDRVVLYFYFVVPGSITDPVYNQMDSAGAGQYQTTVQIPVNASKLTYNIWAYDNFDNPSVSGYISKDVVDDQDPVAVCPVSISLNMGDIYWFNGSASTDNAQIVNYTWSFPYNGSTVFLYGAAPAFRFILPGQYAGGLTVKDKWGNSNRLGFQVNVKDTEGPIADAGIQLFVIAGNLTFLDGSGSSDNMGIVNYTWDFFYGPEEVKLYGVSPSFLFLTPGVYEVILTVTDASGNTDMAYLPVQVLNPPAQHTDYPWWSYILIAMIVIIVVLAIIIIRI